MAEGSHGSWKHAELALLMLRVPTSTVPGGLGADTEQGRVTTQLCILHNYPLRWHLPGHFPLRTLRATLSFLVRPPSQEAAWLAVSSTCIWGGVPAPDSQQAVVSVQASKRPAVDISEFSSTGALVGSAWEGDVSGMPKGYTPAWQGLLSQCCPSPSWGQSVMQWT